MRHEIEVIITRQEIPPAVMRVMWLLLVILYIGIFFMFKDMYGL